jgi:hypothetical protein
VFVACRFYLALNYYAQLRVEYFLNHSDAGRVAPVEDIPKDWITMVDPCIAKMRAQVQEELTAAVTYLAMVSFCFVYLIIFCIRVRV